MKSSDFTTLPISLLPLGRASRYATSAFRHVSWGHGGLSGNLHQESREWLVNESAEGVATAVTGPHDMRA